jgi:uncharacterized protein YciI
MSKRFIYMYEMRTNRADVAGVAPLHHEYWQGLQLDGYMGGPFADRSGGAITFFAPDLHAAEALVDGDPFVSHDLLEQYWLQEWSVR